MKSSEHLNKPGRTASFHTAGWYIGLHSSHAVKDVKILVGKHVSPITLRLNGLFAVNSRQNVEVRQMDVKSINVSCYFLILISSFLY